MPNIPVRDLGKYGVITDVDPYDLPPQAWTMGVNVRFRNNRVSRSPVFRNVTALQANPRYVFGATPVSGMDLVFFSYLDGRVFNFANNNATDFSVSGYVPSDAEAAWSSTALAGVVYVNRPDRAPWSYSPTDSQFNTLANWDSTWRAGLLRTCGGSLVALNVTKGATSYPTMVKTSSFPLSGSVPASWDITLANTLATENILADMRGGIVDAQSFGSSLVIYGSQEAWMMTADGSTQVFSYRKLPFTKGAINSSCSIEIDGTHFVFGPDDIWKHDGYSESSICDAKTREFIFNTINASKANRCFVAHDPKRKDLLFCYVSGDSFARFLNQPDGCNRAAVFNYGTGNWTFDDLPFVFAADQANLSVVKTYTTITESFDTVGGSFLDQEDGFKRTLVYVGSAHADYNLSASLYAFDPYGEGSTVVFGVDTNATAPVYLEKTGIDLDSLGKDLKGYVTVSSIYPEARLDVGAAPLSFTMGAADYYNQAPVYDAQQTYDGAELYKLDYRAAGRYLAIKMTTSDYRSFTLSGLDFELDVTGDR
jgi:hypothetical protein